MKNTPAKITGLVEISSEIADFFKKNVNNIFDFSSFVKNFFQKSATELTAAILAGAVKLESSDIHIEPEKEIAKLRLRVDGILLEAMDFEIKTYKTILSRIKLLSGLKLNVADRPQDGRFTILMEKKSIEIRSSTLPAENGESIVLRILNPENLIEMESLGLKKDLAEIFEKEIKRPNGMVIITGPTGSGKTTTLYAILKKINRPEIKIITIEDPVEYHLVGLSQTQVDSNKGYNFSLGLRSIMRQDPDVILVGEIRDFETGEIALQAALTGHLVFSTLHTNDAAGAIVRLIDLGVKPVSIAPAINMIVAQRLPRKVCKKCAKYSLASPEETEKIKKSLTGVKKEVLPSVFFESKFEIPKIQGCPECNLTGYKGRVGVYEAFLIDDEMEKFILESPSIVEIRELAIKKGMVLMRQDGLIKVLEKITTLEEIERVVGE